MVAEAGRQPKYEHHEKLYDSVHHTNSGAANHNRNTVIEPKDKPKPLNLFLFPEVNECLFLFVFQLTQQNVTEQSQINVTVFNNTLSFSITQSFHRQTKNKPPQDGEEGTHIYVLLCRGSEVVEVDGGRTKSITFEPDSRIRFKAAVGFRQPKHFGYFVRQLYLQD